MPVASEACILCVLRWLGGKGGTRSICAPILHPQRILNLPFGLKGANLNSPSNAPGNFDEGFREQTNFNEDFRASSNHDPCQKS